eukprot:scaffold253931_cov36-Tisochrysis_lutea.AAC.1
MVIGRSAVVPALRGRSVQGAERADEQRWRAANEAKGTKERLGGGSRRQPRRRGQDGRAQAQGVPPDSVLQL